MRFIVAFLFAGLLIGQTPPEFGEAIERLEASVAQNPEDLQARADLLQRYTNLTNAGLTNAPGPPIDRILGAKQRHLLWLIEHHPDAQALGGLSATIDPEGYAQAAQLWREQSGKSGASAKVIANAALFFRAADRGSALSLLLRGLQVYPADPELLRVQGILDFMAFVGASRIDQRGLVAASDPEFRKSADAKKARQEIESSRNAAIPAAAGEAVLQNAGFLNREAILGEQDALELAAQWLRRARDLEPRNGPWTDLLLTALQSESIASLDPREKLKFLEKAFDAAVTDWQQMSVLPNLANAACEAREDAAAEKYARRLLELAEANPKTGNHEDLVHAALTVLGRVALDRGDKQQARERLLESARVKTSPALGTTGPKMTLAQDLVEAGEREAVLQYLDLCRAFWTYDQGKIDHYMKLLKAAGAPDLLARWNPSGQSLVGAQALPFALKDNAGKEWTLEQLSGKVIALEFWNSSCNACVKQLADLEPLARGATVLAVNAGEDERAVRAFAEKNHVKMPVLLAGPGLPPANDAIVRRYQVDTYPTLVVIDRQGQVANYSVGSQAAGALRSAIEQGIAGAPRRALVGAPEPDLLGQWRVVRTGSAEGDV